MMYLHFHFANRKAYSGKRGFYLQNYPISAVLLDYMVGGYCHALRLLAKLKCKQMQLTWKTVVLFAKRLPFDGRMSHAVKLHEFVYFKTAEGGRNV